MPTRTELIDKALENWTSLNEVLHLLTEEEAELALKREIAGHNRSSFVRKLYLRFSKVRKDRERMALLYRNRT